MGTVGVPQEYHTYFTQDAFLISTLFLGDAVSKDFEKV